MAPAPACWEPGQWNGGQRDTVHGEMLLVARRTLRRLSVLLLCAMALSLLAPLPVRAHPSDFRTLTLDLIFGPEGLKAVDGAVVEATGPSYEPFPSQELRREVALDVLVALGVADSPASIDAELSERYHEVGFLVTFEEPLPGHGDVFQIDTEQLQEIAKDISLDWMKLGVCAEDSETFNGLDIQASSDGRAPADNTSERPWCEIWRLGVADPAVTISVQPPVLPMTGLPAVPAGIAGLALLVGGLLVLRRQREDGAA